MRILAIRGCNLASLAGEFEIDLSRAPFSDAGVFAIVGNTGAGKSTLLDALCVALFDRTPRLTNHSRVVIGRGDNDPAALGAQDVRTILRRGAAAGWAEVDFESSSQTGNARRYRARWSVRRARGQTDGALQDQQLTLTAIDGGERFGGTKTETLKAIVARLGLTFDQFRRSALLAQGEFAAFLRADGKDRSELLERMTGTEIYSRLSIAAHLRATLAEQRLRDSRARADAIPILDTVARTAAEADLALANDAKLAARARLAAAETAARWRDEARRLRTDLDEAAHDHAAATAAHAAADSERAELALRRRAEQLRPLWEDAARLDRSLAIARGEATSTESALARARTAHAAIASRRASLAALHEPIRAARIAAHLVERPHLAPTSDELDANIARAESLVAAASDAAAWLVAHAALAPEIAAWPELDTQLTQHAALVDSIASIDRTARDHASTRAKLSAARDTAAADHALALNKLAEAQRKAAAFHQRRGITLDAARRQEDQARLRVADVEALVTIAAAARNATHVRDQIDQQLADLAAATVVDATARARHEADRTLSLALRTERTRVLDDLRRAAGYEHARAELRDDEPCPLCGSPDHPWKDRGAFDDLIHAETLRLAEVAAAVDAANTALAALAARDHQRTLDRDRLARSRETALESATTTTTRWREHLAALGELLLETDPSTHEATRIATDLHAAAVAQLEQARLVFSQTQAATKAAQDAHAEVQLAQTTVDQMHAQVTDHTRRLADLDATLQRLAGERTSRDERRAELEHALTTSVARWSAALVTDEEAPFSTLQPAMPLDDARIAMTEIVTAWRARTERVAAADAATTIALTSIERLERDAERMLSDHAARHDASITRRDALLSELNAAAARLDAQRASARFETDELRRLLSADASRADELAESLAALDRSVERTRVLVAERRTRLENHVASCAILLAPTPSFEAPDADGRLDELRVMHDGNRPVTHDGNRPAMDDGNRPALHDANRPALHDANRLDDTSLDELPVMRDATRLDELAAAVTDADNRAAQLVATLAADADARARREAALATVSHEEAAAEIDRVLGDVIGSHDGKLFRSFAQSLTLDGLLSVANAHLEELAPRYQLERVPRHDLELQVIDRDLGAEVRSVQSLSGGESFLVSLALALGLSSMSAHDVRVRTLLIDEGFGTLDPATLDSALSVLDALQATGRQVGVISHVPALVERVGAHVRVVQRGGGRSEVVVA